MPTRCCTHFKSNASPCRGSAQRGYKLCRHHLDLARRERRRLRAAEPTIPRLGPLADPPAIARALHRVLHALQSGALTDAHAMALVIQIDRARIHTAFALTPPPPYNRQNPSRPT